MSVNSRLLKWLWLSMIIISNGGWTRVACHIKILYTNASHLYNKIHEFRDRTITASAGVIAITKTRAARWVNWCQAMRCWLQDRGDDYTGVGVAVIVEKSIRSVLHLILKLTFSNILVCDVSPEDSSFVSCCVYRPTNWSSTADNFLITLLPSLFELPVCDWNAGYISWNTLSHSIT